MPADTLQTVVLPFLKPGRVLKLLAGTVISGCNGLGLSSGVGADHFQGKLLTSTQAKRAFSRIFRLGWTDQQARNFETRVR